MAEAHVLDVEILDVPAAMTLPAWRYIEKWVTRGVEYSMGCIDADDVKRGLFDGLFKLFLASDENGKIIACAVVELTRYPKKLCCNIVVVAGKANTMMRWQDAMYQAIHDWSKAKGCTVITGIGRRGWTRVATQRFGFQKALTMYHKDL